MFLYKINFPFSYEIKTLISNFNHKDFNKYWSIFYLFKKIEYVIFNDKIITIFFNDGKVLHWSKQNSLSLYNKYLDYFFYIKNGLKNLIINTLELKIKKKISNEELNYIKKISNSLSNSLPESLIKEVPLACLITSPYKEFRDFYKNEIYKNLGYSELEIYS